MLISYVLEAGLHGHGMDELSKLHLGHKPISFKQVAGTGKGRRASSMWADRSRDLLRRRGRRRHPAALQASSPRLAAKAC
jgi:DNA polymerase I-like protein with 3'-5' exonuclease and polymerase domains